MSIEAWVTLVSGVIVALIGLVYNHIMSSNKAVLRLATEVKLSFEDYKKEERVRHEAMLLRVEAFRRESEDRLALVHVRLDTFMREVADRREMIIRETAERGKNQMEQYAELRETVAGFGGIYATRKELADVVAQNQTHRRSST